MSDSQKQQIRDACKEGDVVRVRELLECPSLLNASLSDSYSTPLHYASQYGKEDVVQILLETNANIETKDMYDLTPLHYASEYGKENVVQMLLEAGANIEAKEKDNLTPLHFASLYGKENVVKVLLEADANIQAKTYYDYTPLHYASRNGSENAVKMLLEAKANIEAKTYFDWTPLHYASQNGEEKVVKMLLEAGADPEAKTSAGLKPGEKFSSFVTKSEKERIQMMLNEEGDRRKQQTQEVERIGKIKCKYNGDAIHFTLKKTSTLKELIGMVEQQWGEGKGVKFKDEDGDWVIMNTNDDVVEVWKQTKIGNVSVKVFITQQNQASTPSSSPKPSISKSPPSAASSSLSSQSKKLTSKTASSPNEVQTLLSDQCEKLSWPMKVTGAPTQWVEVNGEYDVVGTSLNLPVFKKKNAEFFMYCAPEKKWVISRTQDGDTTTALLQSEETCEEKQMPSSVSVWKGRQKDQWVDFEEVSVRDYVSFRQVFDLSDEHLQKLDSIGGDLQRGSKMCENLQTIIQLVPKGVVHLASIFEICNGFAAFIEPLSKALNFAGTALGIIGKITQMAIDAVMNQKKCVLLMKSLKTVQPTVNQLANTMIKDLIDMINLLPLPSNKEIAHKKQDMDSIAQALAGLVESMEECKRVIYKWKGWKEGEEQKKDKGKVSKYAKKIATALRQGLTAGTMKDEFIDSGSHFDRALNTLNVALSSRTLTKMEQLTESVGREKWKDQVEREDVIDEKRLGSDVRKLMNENEEFKIEIEVMYDEIGAQITRNHASLQEVLSDEFGKIHKRLDDLEKLLLQTQQQQQPQQFQPAKQNLVHRRLGGWSE